MLLSCLNITSNNLMAFFMSNGCPKEKSSKEDNSLSRTLSTISPILRTSLSQVLMQQPIWKSTTIAVNLKAWTSNEFAAHTLRVMSKHWLYNGIYAHMYCYKDMYILKSRQFLRAFLCQFYVNFMPKGHCKFATFLLNKTCSNKKSYIRIGDCFLISGLLQIFFLS